MTYNYYDYDYTLKTTDEEEFKIYDFIKVGGLKYVFPTLNNKYVPAQNKIGRFITEKELYIFYNLLNNYPLYYEDSIITYKDIGLTIFCDNVDQFNFKIISYNENKNSGVNEPYKTDDTFKYYKGSYKDCGTILTNDDKLVIFDVTFEIKQPLHDNYLPDNFTMDDYNKLLSYKITNIRTVDKSFKEEQLLYRLYVRD